MITEQAIHGVLRSEGTPINVEVLAHTRHSLQVRFPDAAVPPFPFIADEFTIEFDKTSIELGRCRLLAVPGPVSREGLLLPLDDIVDIAELMGKRRRTVQDTGLFNLQLILSQKEKVSQRFKEYTSNLTFELNVYKQYFDDLDRQYLKEPVPVHAHLQQMIIDREGPPFYEFLESKMQELEVQTQGYSKDESEAHGFFFRKQIWDFILHSAFMVRTNLKPRGYAGDYEMMKMIYENELVGQTIFSRLLHRYPLQRPGADAVRNRRRMIAGYLRDAVTNFTNYDFRVMSVACGPAAEIGEAFGDLKVMPRVQFTLLDQDSEALRAAMNSVQQLELEKGWSINVKYVNDSVRSMLRSRGVTKEWGRYDFIYSMGLFDYLTPPVARAILARLFAMLRPGGRLLVGNFHPRNPDRAFMEFWLDWVLYHRTEEEMLELAVTLPGHSRIFFDDTGCQMFLEVSAPNG